MVIMCVQSGRLNNHYNQGKDRQGSENHAKAGDNQTDDNDSLKG